MGKEHPWPSQGLQGHVCAVCAEALQIYFSGERQSKRARQSNQITSCTVGRLWILHCQVRCKAWYRTIHLLKCTVWAVTSGLINGKCTESTGKWQFCQSKFIQIWCKEFLWKKNPNNPHDLISSIHRNGWILISFRLDNPSIEEHQILPRSSPVVHYFRKTAELQYSCIQHYTKSCLQCSMHDPNQGWFSLTSFF